MAGLAIGFEVFAALSAVAGVQLYLTPPVVVRVVPVLRQAAVSAMVRTTGESIVIFTLSRLIKTGAKEISSRAKSLPCTKVFLFTIEIRALVLLPEFHVV